jgi:hypothetical protein
MPLFGIAHHATMAAMKKFIAVTLLGMVFATPAFAARRHQRHKIHHHVHHHVAHRTT